MERVKDITKLKIPAGEAILKVHKTDSSIIAPDGSDASTSADYAEIVLINSTTSDLEVGDIVIEFSTNQAFEWNKETYAKLPVHAIRAAVSPDNFLTNYDIAT